MKCIGSCITREEWQAGAPECFECHEYDTDDMPSRNIVLDLGNARSPPGIDLVPTFTTSNKRMCLMLATGQMGLLRLEDAERLQVRCILWPVCRAFRCSRGQSACRRVGHCHACCRVCSGSVSWCRNECCALGAAWYTLLQLAHNGTARVMHSIITFCSRCC